MLSKELIILLPIICLLYTSYGVVDNRNISKKDWYKSETGINQVMKEFINIGDQTINKELSIR